MDKDLIDFLLGWVPLLAVLSLLPVPIIWTLLEDVAKVRVPLAMGATIPFVTMFFQVFSLMYVEHYVSLQFALNIGFVLVSIGVAAVQYFIFRVTLRQGSGPPIRSVHALVASVVNVALCSILIRWVI